MSTVFRSRDVPSYLPLILLDNTGTAVNGVVAADFLSSSVILILNGVSKTVTFDGYHVQLVPGPSNTGVYYALLEPSYWANWSGPGSNGTITWVALPSATKFVNFIGNGTVLDVPNMFWDHGVYRGVLESMGGAMRAVGAFFLGRYKVDTLSNSRTLYKEDNATPLATGATLDQNGAPNFDPIFETVTSIDTTAPTVSSSVPTNGAANVSVNTIFDVTFSKPMDPTTVTGASMFIRPTSGSPVAGTISQLSPVIFRFTPSSPLNGATSYQGVVMTTAKDPWGNALSVQYVAGFTTA